jgi:hypothetical protein
MDQNYIAELCKLQVGDRIIRYKGVASVHHGIYVGIHDGTPVVAETQSTNGVKYVTLQVFLLNNFSSLKEIKRFKGNEKMREMIIPRINRMLGSPQQMEYFDCERYDDVYNAPTLRQFNRANSNNPVLRVLTQGLIGIFAKRGMF